MIWSLRWVCRPTEKEALTPAKLVSETTMHRWATLKKENSVW